MTLADIFLLITAIILLLLEAVISRKKHLIDIGASVYKNILSFKLNTAFVVTDIIIRVTPTNIRKYAVPLGLFR